MAGMRAGVSSTVTASPTLHVQPVVSRAVANTPKRPSKRRVRRRSGRPRRAGPTKRRLEDTQPGRLEPLHAAGADLDRESPPWVPVIMFTLFGLGMLVIFLNYVDLLLPGASSNWWLLAGLGLDPRRHHHRHPVPLTRRRPGERSPQVCGERCAPVADPIWVTARVTNRVVARTGCDGEVTAT